MKRQKEMARKEKQKQKMERRLERRQNRGLVRPEGEELAGMVPPEGGFPLPVEEPDEPNGDEEQAEP